MSVTYEPASSDRLVWCNSHQRRATYQRITHHPSGLITIEPHCDPDLGGITLPCMCVDLTGICELEDVRL